jgi:HPt (histidine-containing phosphotransfer) domain-containing protein
LPTPSEERAAETEPRNPLKAGRGSDERGAPEPELLSKPLEAVLDPATIRQLRDTLTPDMRRQLVDIFDVQREKCVSDLMEATRCGDRAEIRRGMHMLAGSSASLGATGLRAACEMLENVCRSGDADVTQAQVAELRVLASAVGQALREELI